MLNDWTWATLLALGVWLEIAGWASVLRSRLELGRCASVAFAAALVSQFYFALSLIGARAPGLHLSIAAAGIAALIATNFGKHRLHLKLARSLSPMSWARAWPWLILPLTWLVLRFIDALMPHGDALPLSVNLYSPHRWFEDGIHQIDPLNPLAGAASLWEGLLFHVQALAHGLKATHQTVLVRAQIASQLLHFSVGQVFTIVAAAALISPLIRSGVAATVAAPNAVALAWIAAGLPTISAAGVLARNDWIAAALFMGALLLTQARRTAIACFLAATAVAINPFSWPGLVAIVAVVVFQDKTRLSLTWLLKLLTATVAGFALLAYRNVAHTGSLFFPTEGDPGWITADTLLNFNHAHRFQFDSPLLVALFSVGIIGLYLLARVRASTARQEALIFLAIFTFTNLLVCLFAGLRPLAFVFFPSLLALIGVEAVFMTIAEARKASAWHSRALPYVWLFIGLVNVPLPFHLVWQRLGYAFTPASVYLETYLKHHGEKHWAAVQLPQDDRMVFTDDTQFYYLSQPAASIQASTVLRETLARATNPRSRAQILCDLGFNTLAWEEHRHGPELTGLSAWLKVTNAPVLYSTENITFYKLRCNKP